MKQRTIRIIVVFGVVAIIGILTVQVYLFSKAFNIRQKELTQSIQIALQETAKRLYDYNGSTHPNMNPVEQQSAAYFIVNVDDRIEASILEFFLISELEMRNIRLDFEYAIYDCHDDRMVYGDFIRVEDRVRKPSGVGEMPKHQDFIYYFGVLFPGLKGYLFTQMGIWYFFSIILIIVIIFFGYALFVILRQKRLAEIQKDFVDNMTHEFKTPLTSIELAAEVIADEEIRKEPERLSSYARIIKEQSEVIRKQVDRVLQVSNVKRIRHSVNKSEVDLNEAIREVMKDMKQRIDDAGASVQLELHPSPMVILADPFHLYHMILNLLDNALKYGGAKPGISIATAEEKKGFTLRIEDKGPGIAREYRKRVFDKFFRVPTGNIHQIKGFGLGLYYIRNIVKIHDWKVELESDEGTGTRITVRIKKR
jgi:two-component system phosphate regulon sensor histidine kinase PhoR